MNLSALYGLLASAWLLGILVSLLPLGRQRLLIALGAAGLALTPVLAGESPAMWLHGAIGAPSLTLVVLASRRVQGLPAWPGPASAAIVLAVAALFYPLALGLGPFDPYALGYQPLPILLALAALGLWLTWKRHDTWLLALGLGLAAYAAGMFGNLWDALLDPALAALAGGRLLTAAAGRLKMNPLS